MRIAFIETLCTLASENEKIWLLCGDIGYSVLERFSDRFPERFVNVGVAEQNMTGIAAGLAMEGKTVFTYSIANFPTIRCLEQIRNDICYHNLDVTIVGVGAGFAYGSAGYSHHSLEDIAVMSPLPHMTVMCPSDPITTKWATEKSAKTKGPCYLRLGRGGEANIYKQNTKNDFSEPTLLSDQSNEILFISTGHILNEVIKASEKLAEKGIDTGIIDVTTIKPLAKDVIIKLIKDSRKIISVEEHNPHGGLASVIATVIAT